jgi:succinate-semialdehyde dehydrogenase / glutarate-semialdehyde dehydrogenase
MCARSRRCSAERYSIIATNDGAPSGVQAPFGEVKHSGFGREGGKYIMDEYLEVTNVSWRPSEG